ncbi:hypothetical protein [Patulibacter defluvii]|uniref:hypothetical protein n=1 Tax=Patulibacter defluvii TaxID=3095358 RepID=UPI002A76055A|nr:hypothetical protein [Patulibacter sp. DM4]
MTEQLMSDFVDSLEGELRAAVRREAHPAARTRRRVFAGLGAASAATAAGVLAVVLSSGPSVSVAQAAPILDRPVVSIAQLRRDLPDVAARTRRPDLARAVSVPGGRAYLIFKGSEWCLYGPDPATDHPQEEYGSTCATGVDFTKWGLVSIMGQGAQGYALVAPAGGAPAPTITTSAGKERTLQVDRGVALVVGIEPGDTVTSYSADGESREIEVPDELTGPGPGTMQDCGGGDIRPAGTC